MPHRLKFNRRDFGSILENMLEGCHIISRDWRYIYANQEACEQMKVKKEEILGRKITDVFIGIEKTKFFSGLKKSANTKKPLALEREFTYPDGKKRWFKLLIQPINIGLFILSLDITEKKQAEEKIKKSEKLHRSLFDHMLNGLAYCKMHYDGKGKPLDFTYISVNKAFEKQTGLKNVIGKKVSEIIPGIQKSDPKLFEIYGRVAKTGRPENFEMNVSALAMWFWVSVYSPECGYFVAIFEVITKRKQAEAALKYERDRAQKYLDTVETIIVVLDAKGRITTINRKGCQLFGMSRRELIGKNWFLKCLPQPEGIKKVFPVFEKLMKGERKEIEYFENRIITKKGDVREIAWHNVQLFDDRGMVIGTLSSGEDVTERNRMELALKRSEEKFKLVTINTPDHILVQDAHLKYVMVINPQLGLTEKDMLGKTDFDFLKKEEARKLTAIKKNVLKTGKKIPYNTSLTDPDGNIQYFEGSYVPKFNTKGKIDGIIGYFRNITERKQAEINLRENQEDLNRAQAVAKTGSWRMDVRKNQLTWSDENHRIFGIKKGTHMTYETFLDTIHPDDREYVDQKWQAALKGKPYDIEHRIIVDGKTKWVNEKAELEFDRQGELIGGFGTTMDISEKKIAERKILNSEKKYRSIVETTQEGIIIGAPDGKILFVNQRMAKMLGYTKKEMIGKVGISFLDKKLEKDIIKTRQNLKKGNIVQKELKFLHKNGSVVWTLSNVSPMYDDDGKYIGNLAMHSDITLRKNYENRINHLASFPEMNPNPVLEVDLSGKIKYSNKSLIMVLKRCSVPENISLFLPKDFNVISQLMVKGKITETEREITLGNLLFMEYIHFVDSTKTIRIYAFDITPLRETEKKLLDAEEKLRKSAEIRLIESYRHVGTINRKISLITDLEKYCQFKRKKIEIANYILAAATRLVQASSGFLYVSLGRGKFYLLSEKTQKAKAVQELNARSSRLLKHLNQTKARINGDIKLYQEEILISRSNLDYFVAVPLLKERSLKGLLFLGLEDIQSMDTQDLDFMDVFSKHASDSMVKTGILK
jgi:PAS domain S-box-containing protein